MDNKPIVLVVLDGFGCASESPYNAIAQADTPHLDAWLKKYPHTLLNASGEYVGLLPNTIGNSEVGHQTIGAGTITPQPVTIIHQAIQNNLCGNKRLAENLNKLAQTKHDLHIIGLLSDAGVHSHEELLYAIIECAQKKDIHHIYLHIILDGRDVAPKSAEHYLKKLEQAIKPFDNISIASLHGRFYAMDRDNNLDRTKKTTDILFCPHKETFSSWHDALGHYYQHDITDEFIPPTSLSSQSSLKKDDGIIFFNFRPDRAKQLIRAILKQNNKTLFSFIITPFAFDKTIKTTTLFSKPLITTTLMDVLHRHNKTVFAIAETEKYAHITYFFNAGRDKPYENETWQLVPSIKLKSYATRPEMEAQKITKTVIYSLKNDPKDFYLINYANADMVGHSGDFEATKKAIEFLDLQLEQLYHQVIYNMHGTLIITADHGNAEKMFDTTTGQPHTAHTTNKVPFIVISKETPLSIAQVKSLADIAPYILNTMQIPSLTG